MSYAWQFRSDNTTTTQEVDWRPGSRRILWGWRAQLVRRLRTALHNFEFALYRQQQRSRARYYRKHGIDVPPGYGE